MPDDKANRKYSFKCEHANMRTYVLAAENSESMAQWVKALMMAALMQGSNSSESQPSLISSSFVPSVNSTGDNSGDSGIHTFQSQQSRSNGVQQGPVTPASDNSGQQHQPLYANAPPKPRRVTDCGYSSPSPENAMDQYGQTRARVDPIYGYKQPPQVSNSRIATKTPDPILSLRMQQMRLDSKSPSALNQQTATYPYTNEQRSAVEQEQYMQKLMMHQQQLQQQQKYLANTLPLAYNSERRTPDTYGPSRVAAANDRRVLGDYEDIYQLGKTSAGQQSLDIYRRPGSPTKYDANMQIPPMPQRYTPNFLEHQQPQPQQPSASLHMRQKSVPSVARPHSADFLEYEARNTLSTRLKSEPMQAPRPKSSLDINRSPDNSYYSESNYAEKMRQSALYLQKQAAPLAVPQSQSGNYRNKSLMDILN